MNNKIFSSGDYYNLFYKDKDYQLEAKYIHKKIQEYKPNTNSILELGCGTGKHAINLTKYGYKILGIDKSVSMLKKTIKAQNLEFQQGDIRDIKLQNKFRTLRKKEDDTYLHQVFFHFVDAQGPFVHYAFDAIEDYK